MRKKIFGEEKNIFFLGGEGKRRKIFGEGKSIVLKERKNGEGKGGF